MSAYVSTSEPFSPRLRISRHSSSAGKIYVKGHLHLAWREEEGEGEREKKDKKYEIGQRRKGERKWRLPSRKMFSWKQAKKGVEKELGKIAGAT